MMELLPANCMKKKDANRSLIILKEELVKTLQHIS